MVRDLGNYSILRFSVLFAVLGISRARIFIRWVFVEINLIIFLGVLSGRWNVSHGKRLIYLVVQGVASGVFLWSFLLIGIRQGGQVLAFLAFLIKLAGAPFHLWFFKLIGKLNWVEFFFISTRQKILPLFLIRIIKGLTFMGIIRTSVSFYYRILVKEIKLALGYSSLFGLGWILRGLRYSGILFFLCIYALRLLMVLRGISGEAKSRASFISSNLVRKNIVLVGLLRAIGMPPLFGFWGKIVGLLIIYEHFLLISIILVSISAGLVFMYFRLIFMLIIEKRSFAAVYSGGQTLGVFGAFVFAVLLLI